MNHELNLWRGHKRTQERVDTKHVGAHKCVVIAMDRAVYVRLCHKINHKICTAHKTLHQPGVCNVATHKTISRARHTAQILRVAGISKEVEVYHPHCGVLSKKVVYKI